MLDIELAFNMMNAISFVLLYQFSFILRTNLMGKNVTFKEIWYCTYLWRTNLIIYIYKWSINIMSCISLDDLSFYSIAYVTEKINTSKSYVGVLFYFLNISHRSNQVNPICQCTKKINKQIWRKQCFIIPREMASFQKQQIEMKYKFWHFKP